MEENKKINSSQNTNDKYSSLFNNITKFIDSNIDNNNNSKSNNSLILTEKISSKLNEIDNSQTDITLIKDNFNNTLIQFYLSKNNDNINIILTIINYYKNKLSNSNKDNFNKWLINDNSENLNIFELLIEKQFSLNKQIEFFNNLFAYINFEDKTLLFKFLNNRKTNILHLCVKENNVPLLLFLYEKIQKFYPSINILDIKNIEGMTCLHLSCLYSFKNVSDNLVLLNCNINEKDKKGNTPLHYAVVGGNIKLVKKLILFGADKTIRNNEYCNPKDLARKNANFSINKIFDKKICNDITSIKDKRRENILLAMILLCLLIKILFFIRTNLNKNKIDTLFFIYLLSFVFDAFCLGFIIYPKIFNKKLYKKKSKKNDYNLLNKQIKYEDIYKLNNYDLDKIDRLCPVCKTLKAKKTNHCIICNKCIENWDHHCFWLNICINKETFKLFISFIVTLFILIVFNIIIFISISVKIKVFNPSINFINLIIFVFIIGFLLILFYGAFSLVRQFNQINKNRKIDKQRFFSLEDALSNSSSKSLTDNLNISMAMSYSKYKDINSSKGENSSIEFQEIYN